MTKQKSLSVTEFIQRYDSELPLSHWLDYADPYHFNYIAENIIRIRRIERLLGLNELTIKERQNIANQLKYEAQEKWRKTNKQYLALSKVKLYNRHINWRLCMPKLISLYRIFISIATHSLPAQVRNLFFSRPQPKSKNSRSDSIKTESSNNKQVHSDTSISQTYTKMEQNRY